MYSVKMYTPVGCSGILCACLNHAMMHIIETPYWYYCKLVDEDENIVMFEKERPYYVAEAHILVDSYTGEKFYGGECFETIEEAQTQCPNMDIIELKGRTAYLNL